VKVFVPVDIFGGSASSLDSLCSPLGVQIKKKKSLGRNMQNLDLPVVTSLSSAGVLVPKSEDGSGVPSGVGDGFPPLDSRQYAPLPEDEFNARVSLTSPPATNQGNKALGQSG
jgi:hypothetical protein